MSSTGVCTSTSGFLPPELVDVLKGEVISLGHERRTRSFSVEYYVRDGVPIEARFRTRERVIIVPLTT